MDRKLILILAAAVFLMTGQAFGLTIDIYQSTQTSQINTWIQNLGGNVTTIEDFEDVTPGWSQTLNTDIGTFSSAGAQIGGGDTSYNANNNIDSSDPFFQIIDSGTSYYGRANQSPGGSQWLDSGDITQITLDVIPGYKNLFFYLQDPSDVSAKTTIQSENIIENIFYQQNNGSLWFIGISSSNDIDTIQWLASTQNDGFGLDEFSTVSPVPEPATMLLLGTGLIGLAGAGRKKFFKK